MKRLFSKKRSEVALYSYQAVQLNLVLLEHIHSSAAKLERDDFVSFLYQFAELHEAFMTQEVTGSNCLGKDEVQVYHKKT